MVVGPFSLESVFAGLRFRPLASLIQPVAERLLDFPRLNAVYHQIQQADARASFSERTLAVLGIGHSICASDLERIPPQGPLVVVANHPFGGPEGLLLAALLSRVRPDVRLLANYLLKCIPELQDISFFVDPFEGPDAGRRNLASTRAAIEWLENGGCLGVFPAGEVSHLMLRTRCVTDPSWNDAIGRIILRTKAAVLPVFFDGANSRVFQLLGLLHPRLRTVLLPSELLKKRGTTVSVRIGSVISRGRIGRFQDAGELMDYLRVRTYLLRGRSDPSDRLEKPRPARAARRIPAAIIAPLPSKVLAEEVALLPREQRLLESGAFRVYYARREQIPTLIQEIGRLREITFRQAGEGTGRDIDLDRFDEHYLHLFAWDYENDELVGAYRMGPTDEIVPRLGADGLYTSTLFHYKPQLLKSIGCALELGRSFVVPEYQRTHSALMLLWKGIGRFVTMHPHYRVLFGAVSISDEYQTLTKQILASFLRTNDFRSELGHLVRPKNPPRFAGFRDCQSDLLARVVCDMEAAEELVREIEADRRGIPVLLRQYLRLNARLLGFNIDPAFGDVLDGLVLVDLTQVQRPVLNRYLGTAEAASFLLHHNQPPNPQ